MYSKLFVPDITIPSRISSCYRTLIDNVFSNNFDSEISSGKIISTVSDYYAQFFLTKKNTTQKNYKETLLIKMLLKKT